MADDAQDWLDLFEQTQSSIVDVSSQIRKEEQFGPRNAKQKRVSQRKVNEIKQDLDTLTASLDNMQGNPHSHIGGGELNRRRGLLSKLKGQAKQLEELAGGGKSGRALAMRGSRKAKEYKDTEETRDLSNRGLLVQQEARMQDQDSRLDEVLAGVTTLKVMSEDINQELDLHESLLNDLGDSVDGTDVRLESNVRRVDDVQEKEAGCWPLLIIVLLLVVIVV